MIQDHEEFLQLHWNLHNRGQHYHKSALLLAGDELAEQGLHHLWATQKPMEIVQQQKSGAVGFGQGGEGTQSRDGIARNGITPHCSLGREQPQAAGDVPGSYLPVLLSGVAHNLAFGLVGFAGLQPNAGEGRVHIVGELIGQLHGASPFF